MTLRFSTPREHQNTIVYLKAVDQSTLLAQLAELLAGLVKRNNDTSGLTGGIIAVTDVERARLLLLGTDNENEVVLRQLTRADLLLQSVSTDIDVGVELVVPEDLLHLLGVVVDSRHDRDDKNLARADPEGPLASEVLRNDTEETLETANDGTVNDNGAGTAGTGVSRLGLGFLASFLLVSLSLLLQYCWA